MTKIYEEPSRLRVEGNIELELKSYYCDKDAPKIVSLTGLGGAAGTSYFIDHLARDYNILTFSPRNSGKSNGYFTMDNYISDSIKVIDFVSEKNGRRPFGIGHSTGGYVLAHLLGEMPLVEKAILLAPLLQMSEQNNLLIDIYFKSCIRRNKPLVPGFLLKSDDSNGRYFLMDRQRFNTEHAIPFLKSIYGSPSCGKKLLSPTKVILAGGAFTSIPISSKKLKEFESAWVNLGAEVDVFSDINHWFSGSKWFTGVGDVFCLCEEKGITKNMSDFLNGRGL